MTALVRVLALGLMLTTLTGCIETVAWHLAFEAANGIFSTVVPPYPAYGGRTMCALPDNSQDVRVCTETLIANGWQAVKFDDGEWRPIMVDLEAMR